MGNDGKTFEDRGGEVLTEVGALNELTKVLTKNNSDCEADQEDVGSWITVIGRALLAIFK